MKIKVRHFSVMRQKTVVREFFSKTYKLLSKFVYLYIPPLPAVPLVELTGAAEISAGFFFNNV